MNKTTRSKVACGCGFECCRACAKKYILDETEAKCMNCKRSWDRSFITSQLGSTFVNREYKEHMEDVIFQREQAMFQATMPYVERYKTIMEKLESGKLKKELMEELTEEINKAIKNIESEIGKNPDREVLNREVLNHEVKKANIKYLLNADTSENKEKLILNYVLNKDNKTTESKAPKTYVRRCPNTGCTGFLDQEHKCAICQCLACKDCREIRGFKPEEAKKHKCKKEILESVKLLDSDSKPCPKCGAIIFRIYGCDQMYCVSCHTPFSWKTGQIETGVIHNPHYFEYKRTQGNLERNPLDFKCGREIDEYFMNILRFKMDNLTLPDGWRKENGLFYGPSNQFLHHHPLAEKLFKCALKVLHIRFNDLRFYTVENGIENNLRLRVEFMLGRTSEEKFKKEIQKKNKSIEKRREIFNILNCYIHSATDILYRVYENTTKEMISLAEEEFNGLNKYINECVSKMKKVFKSDFFIDLP